MNAPIFNANPVTPTVDDNPCVDILVNYIKFLSDFFSPYDSSKILGLWASLNFLTNHNDLILLDKKRAKDKRRQVHGVTG